MEKVPKVRALEGKWLKLHVEPSRLNLIAGEIRVVRSDFSDRSKSQDQIFLIASFCSYALSIALQKSSLGLSNFDRNCSRI